jgi:hypothetical protein
MVGRCSRFNDLIDWKYNYFEITKKMQMKAISIENSEEIVGLVRQHGPKVTSLDLR